jgi:hypothetical protein
MSLFARQQGHMRGVLAMVPTKLPANPYVVPSPSPTLPLSLFPGIQQSREAVQAFLQSASPATPDAAAAAAGADAAAAVGGKGVCWRVVDFMGPKEVGGCVLFVGTTALQPGPSLDSISISDSHRARAAHAHCADPVLISIS